MALIPTDMTSVSTFVYTTADTRIVATLSDNSLVGIVNVRIEAITTDTGPWTLYRYLDDSGNLGVAYYLFDSTVSPIANFSLGHLGQGE